MNSAPSLSLRLVVYLLVAQLIGAVATTLAIELFVEDGALLLLQRNRNELAVPRTQSLIVQSLREAPDGSLSIDPSPALRAEMERAPGMVVAVFDPKTNAPLPGSSPELVAQLAGMGRIRTSHMHFAIDGDTRAGMMGHLSVSNTLYGPLALATYGQLFEWWDLLYTLKVEITTYLQYFVLEVLAAIGVGWLAFKRGLEPLKQVAREAERIDMESLHQRLPSAGVPAEVMSLVAAMNGALARLDEGAERQRRFLANAAHELRTPIAILLERLDGPEEPGLMNDLRRDAGRIRNIVEQLLATIRLDRADAKLKETIDLADIAQAMIDDHALLAVKMRRHLALERHGEASLVRGERLALESILANLINNALRAEPVDGTVLVRVGPGAVVEVVDHGAGVSPDDREKLFEPFWRKGDATPGAGLGLAIARELADRLQGRIWVEETQGGGATFKLSFPDVG